MRGPLRLRAPDDAGWAGARAILGPGHLGGEYHCRIHVDHDSGGQPFGALREYGEERIVAQVEILQVHQRVEQGGVERCRAERIESEVEPLEPAEAGEHVRADGVRSEADVDELVPHVEHVQLLEVRQASERPRGQGAQAVRSDRQLAQLRDLAERGRVQVVNAGFIPDVVPAQVQVLQVVEASEEVGRPDSVDRVESVPQRAELPEEAARRARCAQSPVQPVVGHVQYRHAGKPIQVSGPELDQSRAVPVSAQVEVVDRRQIGGGNRGLPGAAAVGGRRRHGSQDTPAHRGRARAEADSGAGAGRLTRQLRVRSGRCERCRTGLRWCVRRGPVSGRYHNGDRVVAADGVAAARHQFDRHRCFVRQVRRNVERRLRVPGFDGHRDNE